MTMPNEILKTSGDIRRFLAQTMTKISSGDLSVDKGVAIAALAKEITSSMQVEVNVAKTKLSLLDIGADIGKITHMGKLIIEDAGSTPVLDGTGQQK